MNSAIRQKLIIFITYYQHNLDMGEHTGIAGDFDQFQTQFLSCFSLCLFPCTISISNESRICYISKTNVHLSLNRLIFFSRLKIYKACFEVLFGNFNSYGNLWRFVNQNYQSNQQNDLTLLFQMLLGNKRCIRLRNCI